VTILRMRIATRILKSTNTLHIHRKSSCTNTPSCYVMPILPVLFSSISFRYLREQQHMRTWRHVYLQPDFFQCTLTPLEDGARKRLAARVCSRPTCEFHSATRTIFGTKEPAGSVINTHAYPLVQL